MKIRPGLPLVLVLALGAVAVRAENWAQWRGPFFNGSTTETNVPVTWSKTENIAWSAPMPGMSGATPAVWGDTVFVSSANAEHQLSLLCLDARDGKLRWQKKLGTGDFVKGNNNLASPSPVTDGERVIALFGTGDLVALDFQGNLLWSRNLGAESGKFSVMWLYGSSPLLHNGRLYVQVLQRNPPTYPYATDDKPARDSYLLCVDPRTGKDLWRHVRVTGAKDESMESYATPIPFRRGDGDELLVVGGDCVSSHRADTGAELWRCFGLNPDRGSWMRVVPSAAAFGDTVIACSPKRGAIFGIRAGGKGDVSSSHIAWKVAENSPDVCTPAVYRDQAFILDGDRKVLTKLNPKTGAVKWRGALPLDGVTRASPTAADGRIYCISENGSVVIADAGDEFKVLATVAMGEGPCRSSIAVSGGRLFIRTAKNLYCVRGD